VIEARFYSQLYGLELSVPPVDLDEGVLLYPDEQEWGWIERADVSEERGPAGNARLACHRLVSEDADYEVLAGPVWAEARAKAADVVLALRLHKPGDVRDWWLVGSTLVTPHDGFVQRRVGRYRQWEPHVPGSRRYRLEDADVEPVRRLTVLCRRYRSSDADNFSTTIALENFGLSYGPWLTDSDRLTMLFTAVEAVFGGFREHDHAGVSLAERAAIAVGGPAGPDAEVRLFWAGPARSLRNRVAHAGLPDDEESAAAVEAVRATLRPALASYVAWSLAARPSGTTPRDGFNAALVAASRGDAVAADLLW